MHTLNRGETKSQMKNGYSLAKNACAISNALLFKRVSIHFFFSPLHGSIFYHSSFLLLLLCKQKTNTVNNKQSMYCCFCECLCIVQEYTRKFWMIGEKCSLSWTGILRCLLLYRNIYYYITYYVCHASVTMTIFQTNHFLFAFLLLLVCSQCF